MAARYGYEHEELSSWPDEECFCWCHREYHEDLYDYFDDKC